MARRTVLVVPALALTLSAVVLAQPSAARDAAEPPRAQAQAAIALPPWLRNLARRWWQKPPRKIAQNFAKRQIKRAAKDYIESGGTECTFPFPERFCTVREKLWGLGQAVWYQGRAPGVWSWSYSPRHEISAALVPGVVYYLTCWQLGTRIWGPWGSTDLWYRVTNGGYVSDALLYTGTDYVIRGVDHC